jgi:predicted aspartyl protease
MGLFRVRGRLTGPTGRSENADLLVDTGATLLVVPRSLAERLELVARRSQPVLIAGGQRAPWPVAEVSLALNGPDVTTPCFIAPTVPRS